MRADTTFVKLIEAWERDASAELSADALPVRLPLDSAAKLDALAELFPLRSREQLAAELLATALDEVVASFPYQQGETVIAHDEEGDPIYEDVGLTPRFLDAVHRHMERLRGGSPPGAPPAGEPGEQPPGASPEAYALLADLNLRLDRQGPGSEQATQKAIALAGLDRTAPLKVADIGCGTGAATLLLARELNAQVTAVDFLPEFIDRLRERAAAAGVAGQVSPLVCDMAQLPFAPAEFDVIWSEGAVYNIGFAAGVTAWREYLRPGGTLVVSEITWASATRPAGVQSYWEAAYPEIDTAAAKVRVLEQAGFALLGYFPLSPDCWLENYYLPLARESEAFLERHGGSAQARALVAENEQELALYRRCSDFYSYGMYIAQKR